MPQPLLPKAEWKRNLQAIEEALRKGYPPPGIPGRGKGALVVAAEALGIPRPTMQGRVEAARSNKYPMPNWKLYKPDQSTEEIAEQQTEVERLRLRIAELARQRAAAAKQLVLLGDIRAGVFNLKPSELVVPKWQLEKHKKPHHPEIPVLLTSDFQCGEVIRSQEIDYPNDYNPEIFSQRYRALVDTAIRLAALHNPKMNYPGFVYNRGGDAISGDIHEDLAETQSLTSIEQCKLVASEEIRGLEILLDAFPQVTVYSVPGNHDRTTRKPRHKRFVEYTYDSFTIYAIEAHFKAKGETRIKFYTPPSGDAYYPVFSTRFLLTHGDRLGSKGGTGFIGPAATIMRGVQKTRQQYARQGKHVDYVLHGHFHTAMELPNAISNGSLAGFNEYAKNELRAEPESPTQTMFFVHPEWGITSRRRIQVAR